MLDADSKLEWERAQSIANRNRIREAQSIQSRSGGSGGSGWGVGNAMTSLSESGFSAPLMYQTAAMLGQDSGFPDYDLLRKTREAVNSAASDEEYIRKLGIQKAKRDLNARPPRKSSAGKSGVYSGEDQYQKRMQLEDRNYSKKMQQEQLLASQQERKNSATDRELERLKLEYERQRRAQALAMLSSLLGGGGAPSAKNTATELTNVGGRMMPQQVSSSQSMLPNLINALSSLA